ncbi:hypothetical protein HGRIS_002401 [Hohenbuehelia grisea]|uniref:GIT Spa2 homology (SHD) domain-containing protein n=1 Tax=Hohenbuehelia grisea TaxID=104357 RepID=A0ABR3JKK4_9AGAR
MKRQPSRAPSPTPTAFSGISNYRTESYRPIKDRNVPSLPQIDYRLVSQVHFHELSAYLAAYLARAAPNSRSTARQKLTRLTIQQFHELSTDVYDELVRRKNENEMPFLPVREEFHPKRNQARQKLATLPTSRFEDLSSDVYFELARRYPEFKEDPNGEPSPGSNYDDYPSPDFPTSSARAQPVPSRTSGRTSEDRPSDSGYGGSRRPSEDRRRPSDVEYSGRRSADNNYGSGRRSADTYGPGRTSEDAYSSSSRRKPSQDTTGAKRYDDRDYPARPSVAASVSYPARPSVAASVSGSDSTANAQSSTATSGMIIPNKSTMAEEEIKVPFGRDPRESLEGRDRSRDRSQESGFTDHEPDTASEYLSPTTPQSPAAGLNGLSARLKDVEDDDDIGPANRSADEYMDRYNRSSTTPDRGPSANSRMQAGRSSVNEDYDKMRRDYEYKVATMQSQITTLQRNLDDASEKERKWKESEARVRQLEEELAGVRRRAEEHSAAMRTLQKDLDDLRETRAREKEREVKRTRQDEEELQILRDRCERLEDERANWQGGADAEGVDQLRSDMEGLLTELEDLSRRNDELMSTRDSDLIAIRDLDTQLKEYKRKYEQAKTELRSVKATSQLYLQGPKLDRTDDQLPVTPDGGLLDIHVTAFLSAIDNLLSAGRSNAPTRVLTPMKAVVNAVTAIVDNVRSYEKRPPSERADVDTDALQALRERAEATLSNLTAAAKSHATSSGMSPVSLLDAAASHVSATVTEIGRTIFIRKATKAEQEQFAPSSTFGASATNGFSPALRSVGELRNESSSHQRKASAASVLSRNGSAGASRLADSPSSRSNGGSRRRAPSDHSSSDATNSPPPTFERRYPNSGGVMSDDSGAAEGSEDAWAELKPYLEAQTESIVYAIQSVLSGVRSPTPPPTLNENLTQIITIVSSIVAVCNDNLPPATAQQGNEILRELSEHANKLSEVQSLPDVTKESRQVMAKSSFAIANAMKGLMKL